MTQYVHDQMNYIEQTIHRLNIRQSDDHSQLTEQYGYLKFDDNDVDSTQRLSQYIRLALHTNARTVVEFMQHAWRLPVPDLIISITGGGKQCHMSTHLRKTFQRGLVAAAATTNAWLFTAGTNTGVVKEVGEAISNYRYKNRKQGLDVPCIGFCTWDYITGSEQLENRRRVSLRSNELDAIVEHLVHCYVVKQADINRYDLEPNHTHFLLFDGQSTNTNDVLLQRASIEKYSRQIDITDPKNEASIPIVMILLEGGPFSVHTICQGLRSNTPLVVVKGSGRAADLVADVHEFISQNEFHRLTSSQLEIIFKKHRSKTNEWIDEIKVDLCQVLRQRKELVVVFEFDSPRHHGNLEDAILEALLKAAKHSGDYIDEQQCRVAELKLAMAWEKFDYAKQHILTDSTISKWTETDLMHALVDALRRGYVNFVELLLDYGVTLSKLTLAELDQLYASRDNENRLPIDKKSRHEHVPTRNDYYSVYFSHHIKADQTCQLGQHAARELFLWSIFLDRFELSKYLCSKTWNQSVAALIAVRIYRQAASLAVHSEVKQNYETKACEFDRHAMSIIDQCFNHDEYFAVDLLKQPAALFDNIEPLKLAAQANCRVFLASECVQRYLDQKWFGHLNYKRSAIHLRIFLCSLFLPLLPLFAVFLPYVYKHQQITYNERNRSKHRSPAMIQTVIRSDRDQSAVLIPWSKKIMYFYEAPIVRFCYYVIFIVAFLGLFSFVVLFDFYPYSIYLERRTLPIRELILHICLWCVILEEFCQFRFIDLKEYFLNIWKAIDIIALVFYSIAFVTRFIMIEECFIVSKIFLCLDLIIWFLRTLHLFAAFERLGPQLVMIFNTMKDMFFFVCFILIFLCGFTITSWSLLSSTSQFDWIYDDQRRLINVTLNHSESNNSWTWQIIRNITHHGVWKIFAKVDPINGTDVYSNIVFVLTIIFVAIANILLLNILIALFNVTIQNVQEQSHDLWRYQRFLIVNEFSKKPIFPPPFNLLVLIRWIICRIRITRQRRRFVASESLLTEVKMFNRNFEQQIRISDAMRRENAIAEDYWKSIINQQVQPTLHDIEQNFTFKIDQLVANTCRYSSKKQINMESEV